MDEFLNCDHLMKATEQFFPVVPFIVLYKVVLAVQSVDEILNRDHPNKYLTGPGC